MLNAHHYRKLATILLWIGLAIVLCHFALATILTYIGAAAQALPYPPHVPQGPLAILSFYLPGLFSLNLAGGCLISAFILWKVSRFKADMEI